jgi:hypothetical protein
MPTTSNFGWTTPADTDYVKDGALAIRTLANGIDTSLVDLKGGTTGQVLSKASNTDLDYSWVTPNVGDITEVQAGTGISVASGTGPIPVITNTVATAFDAAGDLVYGTGADTFTKLALGTAGQVLTVNSGATAPEWKTAASGGFTLIGRTTFSNVSSHIVDNCFTSSYKSYLLILEDVAAATDTDDLQIQWRTGGSSGSTHSSAYYGAARNMDYNPTFTNTVSVNASQLTLSRNAINAMALWVNRVGNQNERPVIYGTGFDYNYAEAIWCGGTAASAITATGFLLKSSSTNITGAVAVYGLAD